MTTKPTNATLPSRIILRTAGMSAYPPGVEHASWSPNVTARLVQSMLAYLDERHAAGQRERPSTLQAAFDAGVEKGRAVSRVEGAAEAKPEREWTPEERDAYYSSLPGDARLVAGLDPVAEPPSPVAGEPQIKKSVFDEVVESYNRMVERLQSQIAAVEAERNEMTHQRDDANTHAIMLESALAEANARAERLEGELARLRSAPSVREALDAFYASGASAPSQPLQDAQPVEREIEAPRVTQKIWQVLSRDADGDDDWEVNDPGPYTQAEADRRVEMWSISSSIYRFKTARIPDPPATPEPVSETKGEA